MNSISVFLTTTGRPTLTNMLKSLISELEINDFLYIAIDGEDYFDKASKQIVQFINDLNCNINILYIIYLMSNRPFVSISFNNKDFKFLVPLNKDSHINREPNLYINDFNKSVKFLSSFLS